MGSSGPSEFGVRLRRLRIDTGLTQEVLAGRSGISVDAISALETGRRRRPHPQTVSMLADGLGLGAEERERLAGLARPAPRPTSAAAEHEAQITGLARVLGLVLRRRRWAGAAVCGVVLAGSLMPWLGSRMGLGWWAPVTVLGPHDQFLEADLTALQAASYVLPGDPDSYSPKSLPPTEGQAAVVAERIESIGTTASVPYRVIVRIHDLRHGGSGMFIEAVTLLLREVRPVPIPLRVWEVGAPLEYQGNPYRAVFDGREPDSTALVARYAGRVSQAHVQLAPGETDELAVEVASHVAVYLQFQVRLVYRIASATNVRSLTLPYGFRVVFSDELNWQPYQLRSGHLVPV